MHWLPPLGLSLVMLGVATVIYVLTDDLSPQPEYSVQMTRVLRAFGWVIVAASVLLAAFTLAYALVAILSAGGLAIVSAVVPTG